MTEFIPSEKGVPIRQPSTANLMIDSADRIDPLGSSAFDFQIQKNYSLMNGFFTRIGTTEVVLEWCQDNISGLDLSNNFMSFDISGIAPNTYSGTQSIQLVSGFYTAADAYNALIIILNDLSGTTGAVFSVNTDPGGPYFECTGAFFATNGEKLARHLDLANVAESTFLGGSVTGVPITCPDLRPYRYIDFVAPQLTYAQDVKDATTAKISRDVLCRWYMSWDTPPQLDAYGYPILMGYTRFCARRLYNPPKQIKWDTNLPIGNLSFQVFDDNQLLLPESALATNWLMTLQISEV